LDIEPRVYLNMKKRIIGGRAANNLNGTYIGLILQHPLLRVDSVYAHAAYKNNGALALSFGWQRRVSTSFFADLSLLVGVRQIQRPLCNGNCAEVDFKTPSSTLFLTTNARIGIASTFIRNKPPKPEMCDFLKCYEEVNHLWKVDLLQILQLDKYYQSLNLGVEYEQKIGLGFSINTGFSLRAEHFNGIKLVPTPIKPTREVFNQSAIKSRLGFDLRYYPYVRQKATMEHFANSLSGGYFLMGIYRNDVLSGRALDISNNADVLLGYGIQYKITERGFFNMQFAFTPYQYLKNWNVSLSSSTKLGFAF